MDDLYAELDKNGNQDEGAEITRRHDLKKIYFDFLRDFKTYLAEFVRESLVELVVAEIPVSTNPVQLFQGEHGGMRLTLKNQGNVDCWISTGTQGGYKLSPGEKENLWLNKALVATTLSGTTTLGLIRT